MKNEVYKPQEDMAYSGVYVEHLDRQHSTLMYLEIRVSAPLRKSDKDEYSGRYLLR